MEVPGLREVPARGLGTLEKQVREPALLRLGREFCWDREDGNLEDQVLENFGLVSNHVLFYFGRWGDRSPK